MEKSFSALLLCFVLPTLLVSCNEEPTFASGDQPRHQNLSLTKTFNVAQTKRSSVQYLYEQDTLRQAFDLVIAPPTIKKFKQIERPIHTDKLTQGHNGEDNNEDFEATTAGKLDVLLIVDDSNSMEPYQNLLAPRLENLLLDIDNADWQIAIITTTSACLRNNGSPITRREYILDPAGTRLKFANAVNAGERGNSGAEMGIKRAVEGLIGHCGDPNQRWTRPDSNRAVLILTDEENCGGAPNDGKDCKGTPWETADYFFDNAPSLDKTQFFGILHDDENNGCPYYGWPDPSEYRRLIDGSRSKNGPLLMPPGLEGNICTDNYEVILEEISQRIMRQPRQEFDLAYAPVPSSLVVKLDGERLIPDTDYTVAGNILSLIRTVTLANNKVSLSYKHSPQPIKQNFELAHVPDDSTVLVMMNGQAMSDDLYRIDVGVVPELYFFDMPPLRAKLVVSYRDNSPLPAKFTFKEEALARTLSTRVDGVITKAEMCENNNAICLEKAPKDGNQIEIHYNTAKDIQTHYPVVGIKGVEIEDFTIVDGDDSTLEEVEIDGDHLVFDADQVWTGRQIMADYRIKPSELPMALTLPEEIMAESITVTSQGGENPCVENYVIVENEIQFKCPGSELRHAEISFDLAIGIQDSYVFEGEFDANGTWSVLVDGEIFEDFERHDNVITIPSELLSRESVVEITVNWREAL
jgi:hypothetical protein